MNRLQKLLAAATLLVLPVIAACGEDPVPPPATGSIQGQVSIEGMGIDGVSVNLSNGASTTTAGGGTYRFDGVLAGAYTVTISGFPADASFDATSAAATIPENGGSVTLDFRGSYIRTASIMGTVTVENTGLGGVTVRLSGMADAQTATDNNGQYAFTGLRSGTYAVEISGFDMDEVGFGATSSSATVGVGESKIISFDGTYLRTAGIMGQVSVEGVGLAGVTVSLAGEGEEGTTTTDAGGLYAFSKLKAGDYSVAISGYDTDDHEFATTSMNVTVALGETANVPFDGTLLRTSGISGRVSVDDGEGGSSMALDGVEVVLAGAAEATAMTSNGGQYAFAGLAEGTYVVSMMNPNETAYSFETTSATIVLGDAESNITNFEGTHTRTASVSGMLFIDEALADGMYTANEPAFMHAGIPVALQGPGVNDLNGTVTLEDGSYSFDGLIAGDYRVLVDYNETVAAMFAAGGFVFKGELTGTVVSVDAGGTANANFPVGITMQTIGVGARMGYGEDLGVPVGGVKLSVYANADMTGMLGEGTTDSTGVASVTFARADNTGPGGNDNLVFLSVSESGHEDLEVSGGGVIEVSYPATARIHPAPAAVTLVNTMANFQYWVKSAMEARGGGMGLEGWATEIYMGDTEAEDAMPLEMGPDATDADGKATFSYKIDKAMLADGPATFTVMVTEDQDDDIDWDEQYDQSEALVHTHNALAHPDMNTMEINDRGPIYVEFTTQSLFIGAHRELDDRTGFTDYIGVDGMGDARATGHAVGKIEVRLMEPDDRGRLRQYKYDDDLDDETDDIAAVAMFTGGNTVVFEHVEAGVNITVVADAPRGMTIVPDDRATREIDAYGDQLDDYPDGIMVGAFGDGSGARPDVWICPLQRQEDAKVNCSTFAYKWDDGSIEGVVNGLRDGDEDVAITLEPVHSNDDYSADFEDDDEVDFDEDGPTAYRFPNVADGQYEVILAGVDGAWKADTTATISVVHDESASGDDDDTGAVTVPADELSATQLRLAIQGTVANNRGGGTTLVGSESRPGVMLKLFKAGRLTRGRDAGKYVPGDPVLDEDGAQMTAETDADGNYAFRGLSEGTNRYMVEAVSEAGRYMAVRSSRGLLAAENANGMYSHALVTATDFDDEKEQSLPSWSHATSAMSSAGGADFALLYEDGTVEGVVSDPSARGAHEDATVELRRCAAYQPDADATPAVSQYECTKLLSRAASRTASVDEDGEWFVEDLLEGHYEVTARLPTRYSHAKEDGTTDSPVNGADGYYSSQVASLTSGARDADETATFHIVDRDASDGIGAPTAEVKDGADVLAADGFVTYNTSSVSLTLTNADGSEGATLKVGKKSFTSKRASSWAVAEGANALKVIVTSANGYATTETGEPGGIDPEPATTINRDADTRLAMVEIDPTGVNNDQVLNRSAITARSGVSRDEELRSEEIAGDRDGSTTIDLGTITVAATTTTYTVTGSAMSDDNATALTTNATALGDDNTEQEVTITVTDNNTNRGTENTRMYTITIKRAS